MAFLWRLMLPMICSLRFQDNIYSFQLLLRLTTLTKTNQLSISARERWVSEFNKLLFIRTKIQTKLGLRTMDRNQEPGRTAHQLATGILQRIVVGADAHVAGESFAFLVSWCYHGFVGTGCRLGSSPHRR